VTASVLFYSDYVCPYCYVAERGTLGRLEQQYDIDVTWRGFQLHPHVPPGGVSVDEMFGPGKARSFAKRMGSFAAEFGVELGAVDRIPSTLKALAATEYARDRGALGPFRDAVMDAHWHDGKDIESDDQLAALADGVGLDAGEAVAAGTDPAYVDRVRAARVEAHDKMVTGIPTLFIDGYMVVGCQTYDTLEKVAHKVGLRER
jgi:predicted DsbA family dithiol-disulfide isomerase